MSWKVISQLALAGCLFVFLGCDTSLDLDLDTEPLTVSVTTNGVNLDSDGYQISVTGSPTETVGINETMVFNVFGDSVNVELMGVATNCVVDLNPRTIPISGPTTVTFVVECS